MFSLDFDDSIAESGLPVYCTGWQWKCKVCGLPCRSTYFYFECKEKFVPVSVRCALGGHGKYVWNLEIYPCITKDQLQ